MSNPQDNTSERGMASHGQRPVKRMLLGIGAAGVLAVVLAVGSLDYFGILPIHRVQRIVTAPVRIPEPADTREPIRYERPVFAFSYPANWKLDTADKHFDPDGFLIIDAPKKGQFRIQVVSVELNAADTVEQIAQRFGDLAVPGLRISGRSDFQSWGRFQGAGITLSGQKLGEPIQVRLFAHSGLTGSFVVWEYWWDGPQSINASGFELIEESFELSLPAGAATE